MRPPAGQRVLRLLGGLCGTLGFLAWIGLAWRAVSGLDDVTPESEAGGRLMVWAVAGTVLMIGGTILLHFAVDAAERDGPDERRPPR